MSNPLFFSSLLILLSLSLSLSPSLGASDLKVYGLSSPFSPTKGMWEKNVGEISAKDDARLIYLGSLVARKSNVPIASGRQIIQSATYVVRVTVGTPPQTMLMAMDTSSDTAWMPCDGCVGCSANVFVSANSNTYKSYGCDAPQCKQVTNPSCAAGVCSFNLTYGGSTVAANLSQDTIILAKDPIVNYSFGCLQRVTGNSVPPQGIIGLGRGPTSLLSQSQSLYQSTFSYCLPNFKSLSFSGSLRLGPVAQPKKIKYTPLLKNPRRSSLYYVNLIGISVGRKLVDIPPSALAFNPTTGSGTIFDSGTVFTRLVAPAYNAVRDEFRNRFKNATVSSLGGFDTCYTVPILGPTMTFHFTGMNVTLPLDNMLIHSTSGSLTCLAMAAAPDNVNSVLNVIANMQQMNHRVLFDVPNSRLGISREVCT
ncbi:hypothetical protein GIB67_019925 [Kingdonia uniflora]|uniref:Peptidase A1 domain-containing protein n=1 Tax=Kingdonia uniflora TaxID=39325 RepID=A0A7J7MKH5_9MAGN|nr:hypothetical protein GIB67_019925 [Kingdonia uniflora]